MSCVWSSFLSYVADKHTEKQTDGLERILPTFTVKDIVGVGNYSHAKSQLKTGLYVTCVKVGT